MPAIRIVFFLLNFLYLSSNLYANETETDEAGHSLKLDKDGIKVYIFSHKDSEFATFKAVTHINASVDSILAVMLDNESYTQWIHACEDSFVIEDVNFNERYHYQAISLPFPFENRDFLFHSTLKQDPITKEFTITMSSVSDYCQNKSSKQCKKVNQSTMVRVKKSIGTYRLEPEDKGIKITWIQHTDPAGKLPSWLVNSVLQDTAYWTLKKLSVKVKEKKYQYAKLIYNHQGLALNFDTPANVSIKDFPHYPTF